MLWGETEKNETLESDALENFENNVNIGFFEIVLTRKPEGSEDDIAKLKKAKPKNLNLGELYAAKYKGKVDVSGLATPGATKIVKRVPILFAGEIPA